MQANNSLNVMEALAPRLVWAQRSTGRLTVLPHKHRGPSLTGRITLATLHQACKAVKRNRGAAGRDTPSIKMFDANLAETLLALRRELQSGP